jgi:hypothetical protein
MNNDDEELTEEGLKRKAFMIALPLKNSTLDEEQIYVKLEKEGIPVDLAKEVAAAIITERYNENRSEAKSYFSGRAALFLGLGIVGCIISWVVLDGEITVPIGLLGGGVVCAIISISV